MMRREEDRAVAAPAAGETPPRGAVTARDRPAPSRHGPIAQLLIAWSPLSVILLIYATAQWVSAPLGARGSGGGTNRVGFELHVAGPARADEQIFGVLPSVWLQGPLVDGSTHWYDAAAALVYVTHLISIPLMTAFVWFRLRHRFRAWLSSVLTLTILGAGGYVVYPAAPPWLASELGVIDSVSRISTVGWDYLHLGEVGRLIEIGQAGSNPVAAMPSLHAGSALLVALFLWPSANRWWRAALVTYAMLMALTLVYTGEHYVVDILAGWLTAVAAVAAGAAVHRRRSTLAARRNAAEPRPRRGSEVGGGRRGPR